MVHIQHRSINEVGIFEGRRGPVVCLVGEIPFLGRGGLARFGDVLEAEATRKIFATRATTWDGVKIKIALMMQLCETGSEDPDFPLPQLPSMFGDVIRLEA